MILLAAILSLATGSCAYTRFDTTCSVPTTPVNFVTSPDSRGTLDILWSCLFTIIACTWTIQHLNIPEQRDNLRERMERRRAGLKYHRGHNFRQRLWYDIVEGAKHLLGDVRWAAGDVLTTFKWMVFTMFAPEFILGKAIGDFLIALELKKKMEDFAEEDGVEWGLSHGFFANTGGFRAIASPQTDSSTQTGEDSLDDQKPQSPTDLGIKPDDSRAGERSVRVTNVTSNESPQFDTDIADGQDLVDSFILSGYDIYKLRARKAIKRLPAITATEIHDKGKANFFVKVLAVLQVLWISIQVIVRSARGLSISQLELVVTAFSLCAIITYVFLIQKPQGVRTPMRPIKVGLAHMHHIHQDWIALRILVLPLPNTWDTQYLKPPPGTRVPNDYVVLETGLSIPYALGMIIGGMVFGAIHTAGWNLDFPTSIEQTLWRVSSILIVCLLPVTLLSYILIGLDDSEWDIFDIAPTIIRLLEKIGVGVFGLQVWGFIFGVVYVVARLFLLIETFRTLVYLPSDAYIATWVSNIPSVG